MNTDETRRVLRTLTSAYGRQPDDAMIETWSVSLSTVSPEIAQDCALDWVEHEDRMPSLNSFLLNCQTEARHRALVRNGGDRQLPPAPVPEDVRRIREAEQHRRSKAQIGLLAEVIRGHAEDEPMTDDEIAAIVNADRVAPLDDENAPRICSCGGSGLVYVDGQNRPNERGDFARPCEHCNTEAFALWRGGHMMPGHRCDICRPHRRRSA